MTHYGRARTTHCPRAHIGLKQERRTVDGSEAAYLRARAAITASLIGPAGDLLPKRTDLVADDWAPTPSQAREIGFNENKVKTAKVEALLSGFLEDEAVSWELVDAADSHLQRLTKNQQALKSAKARTQRITQKTAPGLDGLAVYFFVECGGAAGIIHKLGMSRAGSAAVANVIVVPDLGAAPLDVVLVAGLAGVALASPVCFDSEGRKGDALLSPGPPP